MELGLANITPKLFFFRQTPLAFEGIGRIYFVLAEFFGPLGRTPFRGPGNTGLVVKRTAQKKKSLPSPPF